MMHWLENFVDVFIQTFGITKPTEEQRRRVTLVLGAALLTVVALVAAVAIGMMVYLHRGA